jgi:hypothetical protein
MQIFSRTISDTLVCYSNFKNISHYLFLKGFSPILQIQVFVQHLSVESTYNELHLFGEVILLGLFGAMR